MKCIVCHQRKGKRECVLYEATGICGQCCAAIRVPEKCSECLNFKKAEKYQEERIRHSRRPQFLMRIDEKVEEEISQALEQIEAGGKTRKSKNRIRELYQENPDLACTQYAMGVTHLVKGEPGEALAYFHEAVNTNPYFGEAYFNLSECYRRNMDFINAIRTLQTALEILPYDKDDTVRTQIDYALERYIDYIKKSEGVSLEAFLKYAEAFERGFKKAENKKWRQAIPDFEESIRHKPKSPQAYGNLGICRARLGEKEQGRRMLEKALALDPSYEPAKWNLKALDKLADDEDSADYVSIDYAAARYQKKQKN